MEPLAALVLAGWLAVSHERFCYDDYTRRRITLDLPGARYIKVEPSQREFYYRLVKALQPFDTFMSTISLNSVYLWTNKPPPFRTLLSHDMTVFTDAEQEQMIQALLSHPNPAIIRGPQHQPHFPVLPPQSPLMRGIREHFTVVTKVGDYEVLAKRSLAPPRQPVQLEQPEP